MANETPNFPLQSTVVKTYRILGTNHTSFTVSSLDRSIAFFIACLGFSLGSRAGRDPALIEKIVGVPGADIEVAYLSGHGHVVELIEYRRPTKRKLGGLQACDSGFAHLAFDVEGIDAVISAAAKHGFKPHSPPVLTGSGGPNAGRKVVYLRDADGVVIELIEPVPI
jgi:catechol 2,3-dioxygenase-like lactoylglutathione lyase family enzyme